MIVEIKIKPNEELQKSKEWFPIHDTGGMISLCGDHAYARVLDEKEYILIEPTTADEFNNTFKYEDEMYDKDKDWTQEEYDEIIKDYSHSAEVISDRDPGDEHNEGYGERRIKHRREWKNNHMFGRRKQKDRRE